MTDQAIVRESVVEIFKRNGYADVQRLTQRDFEHVSQEIQAATGILISGATIKRLLNGDFTRLPQIATLDAICKYLGYKNWQDYKVSGGHPIQPNPITAVGNMETPVTYPSPKRSFRITPVVYVLITAAILAVGFRLFSNANTDSNFDKASFSVKRNTISDIPNTVVFNYNIDDVNADSFFIQQSWDKNRRVKVYKNKYTLTDIYYEPGYHLAKLIANDSVIRAVEVNIPTAGWFVFARDPQPASNPEYIPSWKMGGESLMVTESDLTASKIDTGLPKEYVYTCFPEIQKVSSDNFILKARVRMKPVRNNHCPFITLEVFTQRYFFIHKTTSTGCAAEAQLQFGEKFIDGKDNDLAMLGHDVTQWIDVEWKVKDRHVTIRLNNEEVYSTTYQVDSKLITGLGFVSNGLCEVDFVELKGLDGSVVYENAFQ